MTNAAPAPNTRRTDLDWLRIAAFGLLILYHVGMFYVSWDWHVKSSRAGPALEPLMLMTNPWRLTLLFLIAGCASRFMTDGSSAWRFLKSRIGRLLPPLALAVFVIVPPQSYYEIVEGLRADPSLPKTLLDGFYLKYITASGNWCDANGCLTTPTYNHMWFVAYLLAYAIVLAALLPLMRRMPAGLFRPLARVIEGPGLALLPFAFLAAARILLYPAFGATHDIRNDPYVHVISFGAFLFGYAIAKDETAFARFERWRWAALAIAIVSWAGFAIAAATIIGSSPEWMKVAARAVREAEAWAAIVAALGFASRHWRHADGPIRRTLTQAIFPFYLIHQTIIVVLGHHLDRLRLPLALEAGLLIAGTALGCWLFYDLTRRIPWLRVWVGLPRTSDPPRLSASHAQRRGTKPNVAR